VSNVPSIPLQGRAGLAVIAGLALAACISAGLYVAGLRTGIESLAMAVIFAGGAALGWAERRRRMRAQPSQVEE